MRFPLFFLFFTSLFAEDWVDLEAHPDPCVLEVKQIEIPGFPNAFNPSIVRYKDQFLMSFRDIPSRKNPYNANIGVIWLDKNFNPIGTPQLLANRKSDHPVPSRAEDGRLIWMGKRLYMIYDDNEDPIIGKGGFRMFIGEIRWNGEKFSLENIEKITRYQGANPMVREKAWTPFDYEGNLLLSYSIVPHQIFSPHFGRGFCRTVAESKRDVTWPWGTIRGGTPALQGVADKNEYLSFFHSSIRTESLQSEGKTMLHYFIGAFTFSPDPPFPITRISAEPIIGKQFYSGKVHQHYWHPLRCIFPAGYVFDEKYIYLFYGRQDHEIWVAQLDREGLMNRLVPVRED